MRHSKAGDGPTDAKRPLAPRGRRDAAAIGTWLVDAAVLPDLVVCSTALRAVQTWERASTAFEAPPPVEEDERVYDNTVDALAEVIRETSEQVRTLALVGHNPSMAALAAELDDHTGDAALRGALADGYPTSGVAVFSLGVGWSEVEAGTGTLTHFSAARG